MVTDSEYRITLRIPSKKLKNAIKKSAQKNGRSLNAEIIQAIEMYIVNPYWKVEYPIEQSNKK